MSGINLLADTNILLYLLSGDITVSALLDSKRLFISFITEIELLTFKKLKPDERRIIKDLLDRCTIIGLSEEIIVKAIEIKLNHNLKIPDAIIAATSSYLKIPLISADAQFKRILDIDLIFYQF